MSSTSSAIQGVHTGRGPPAGRLCSSCPSVATGALKAAPTAPLLVLGAPPPEGPAVPHPGPSCPPCSDQVRPAGRGRGGPRGNRGSSWEVAQHRLLGAEQPSAWPVLASGPREGQGSGGAEGRPARASMPLASVCSSLVPTESARALPAARPEEEGGGLAVAGAGIAWPPFHICARAQGHLLGLLRGRGAGWAGAGRTCGLGPGWPRGAPLAAGCGVVPGPP